MLYTGLVSVTFRDLSPAGIVALAVQAGLDSIEWGGDVHVPHGALATAVTAHKLTTDAGLSISAYGSYYRAGEDDPDAFEAVLATAVALKAPVIRVWAGKKGSAHADEAYAACVVRDSRRIADLAASANVRLGYEYHENTLTDSWETAVSLVTAVSHPHMKLFWQPHDKRPFAYNIAGLQAVMPYLLNVHVCQWEPRRATPLFTRLPLRQGQKEWAAYIKLLQTLAQDIPFSLEFVWDNTQKSFFEDAALLKNLLHHQAV